MDSALEGWNEFNLAVAGAGAALAGLLIVAMSVNITRILAAATLPTRAGASIGAVMLAVVASCLALIPGQPLALLGTEILVGALLVWVLETFAFRAILREQGTGGPARTMKIMVGVIPPAAFTVGAVLLITGTDAGFAWVAAGAVLAIIGAVVFSWIALVEILR